MFGWLTGKRSGEFLRTVSFLKELSPQQLDQLGRRLSTVRAKPGDIIIREGEAGDAMYYVTEGEVAVSVQESTVIARLKAGDFFGEMALVLDEPRNATVTAATSCVLFKLKKADVVYMASTSPALRTALQHAYVERAAGAYLARLPGFAELAPELRAEAAAAFRPVRLPAGVSLEEIWPPGTELLVVVSGKLFLTRPASPRERVELHPGNSLTHQRAALIRTESLVEALTLSAKGLQALEGREELRQALRKGNVPQTSN